MVKKNRVASAVLAACLALGGGVAVAAPAQAATMVQQDIVIRKSGYSSQSYCQYILRMTLRQYLAAGWQHTGGDPCLYSGSTKKWGFALVFTKSLPLPS